MPQMQPPHVGRHSAWLAVYWFLHWYQCNSAGQPFTFSAQYELAHAVGVAPSVITRLRKAADAGEVTWITFGPRSAFVTTTE